MKYEAIKYLARYIGYGTGLICAGTLFSSGWYGISMIVSQDADTYTIAKRRIKNLLVAFSISLIVTGTLLTWAAGYIEDAASWVKTIIGWSK